MYMVNFRRRQKGIFGLCTTKHLNPNNPCMGKITIAHHRLSTHIRSARLYTAQSNWGACLSVTRLQSNSRSFVHGGRGASPSPSGLSVSSLSSPFQLEVTMESKGASRVVLAPRWPSSVRSYTSARSPLVHHVVVLRVLLSTTLEAIIFQSSWLKLVE